MRVIHAMAAPAPSAGRSNPYSKTRRDTRSLWGHDLQDSVLRKESNV
jgi:hypothetical protein